MKISSLEISKELYKQKLGEFYKSKTQLSILLTHRLGLGLPWNCTILTMILPPFSYCYRVILLSIISNFCSTRGNFRDINVRVIVFKDHLNSISVVVCPFVLFLLAIVLSVLLRYTDSDYPFDIFKLFFVSDMRQVGGFLWLFQ
jgi:hypothetical protein